MNKLLLVLCLMPAVTLATENSLNNVLNNNGNVSNVTINQSNSITNEQVESQAKIDAAILEALQENNAHKATVVEMANEVNQQSASSNQKNQLCKSKAEVGAVILGYKVDFAFGMCDEFFTITN